MRSILAFMLASSAAVGQPAPRARDLGVPFDGTPGRNNAITDVPGVEVGYSTLIRGSGRWVLGQGPVRTGVTVVLPKGKTNRAYNAGYFVFNGDGEMTGLSYVHDYGQQGGPIGITNTNSVGIVRDAIGAWSYEQFGKGQSMEFSFGLPIVAETWDGFLNDINGYHVKKEHVVDAIHTETSGAIAEGNVGSGTGMMAYWLKAGTGTSSRVVSTARSSYTVGVLVRANFGRRDDLVIAGVPVGKEIADLEPVERPRDGSIIIIVGTDAPLSGAQLTLVAKRATLGMARTGKVGESGSGDLFFAFSTASATFDSTSQTISTRVFPKHAIDDILRVTVEATEEAIINSLVAARDMDGVNGNKVFALPHERLRAALRMYNRMRE
jgi:L-aminopeptidase/D-esterase-like protein